MSQRCVLHNVIRHLRQAVKADSTRLLSNRDVGLVMSAFVIFYHHSGVGQLTVGLCRPLAQLDCTIPTGSLTRCERCLSLFLSLTHSFVGEGEGGREDESAGRRECGKEEGEGWREGK